jgi:hypothetical protein
MKKYVKCSKSSKSCRKIMASTYARQIRLEDQDIRPIDMFVESETDITTSWEMWFDVDAYFGTDTKSDDSKWINFYTFYNYDTDRLSAMYEIDSDDGVEDFHWELTKSEEKFLRDKLENYCLNEYAESLRRFVEEELDLI